MSVLWLITARGGSKGVPGKNLCRIGGTSLVGWKAQAAQLVRRMYSHERSRLIISTDSAEIANEAAHWNVEVPFMRPPALATSDAKSDDVIKHALEWVAQDEGKPEPYSQVMLLEPSSPFASPEHFHKALLKSTQNNAQLVAGMKRTTPASYFVKAQQKDDWIGDICVRVMRHAGEGNRRQDLAPEWTMNGALYLFDWRTFMESGSIYGAPRAFGLLMDYWHSIEIDEPEDLELAQYAHASGHVVGPRDDGLWQKRLDAYKPVALEAITRENQ